MATNPGIQIDLNVYIAQKAQDKPGMKIVSLDGLAYMQIRQFDSTNGKQLPPQLIAMSSDGVQSVIDAIERDLANHKVLLADVKAAEEQAPAG